MRDWSAGQNIGPTDQSEVIAEFQQAAVVDCFVLRPVVRKGREAKDLTIKF